MVKQTAFVFAKPHADLPAVHAVMKTKFDEVGINVLKEGDISGKSIDENKYIDQHYYAIASKATILTPDKLNIPTDKFKDQFGEEWSKVLEDGRAFNAMDACTKLGVDAVALDKIWGKAKKAGKLIKFGGGFYCGYLENDAEDKPLATPIYTFNAFFMEMRGKFTSADAHIHYFLVEYDSDTLKWADFRGKVLGPTDPAAAPADALRGIISADWEKLGLSGPCNTGDNAVHASASPFEGLAEQMNWLQMKIEENPFGAALLKAGIPEDTIKAWSVDPQVKIAGDKKGSIFDQLEDMDFQECLDTCTTLYKMQ